MIFKNRDFTRDWVPQPDQVIELDLSKNRLCGIGLNDPVHFLERLGPAEDKKRVAGGMLCYYSKGLQIDFNKNRLIESFVVYFNDETNPDYRCFQGAVRFKGAGYRSEQIGTEQMFKGLFGGPYWRSQDEDEIILFYEYGLIEWQVEFRLSGGIKVILITTPPLLADERQRKAYDVTRKWPPGF
ncbi:hypothetical protein JXA40_02340 [bacterium]|nr:hypothetical protein [candidate division CSSED10-310 bacterium]